MGASGQAQKTSISFATIGQVRGFHDNQWAGLKSEALHVAGDDLCLHGFPENSWRRSLISWRSTRTALGAVIPIRVLLP